MDALARFGGGTLQQLLPAARDNRTRYATPGDGCTLGLYRARAVARESRSAGVMVRIRRARIDDLPKAKMMLSAAGLPVTDLAAEHLAFTAVDGERMAGMIGLEPYGHIG